MSTSRTNNQHLTVSGLRTESNARETGGPQLPRLITKAELRSMVPYTPQHILRLEKRGLFPRRIQVGSNRVAWLLAEVEDWIAKRVAERDTVTNVPRNRPSL